jgi:hypothetical protein
MPLTEVHDTIRRLNLGTFDTAQAKKRRREKARIDRFRITALLPKIKLRSKACLADISAIRN